MTATDRIAAVLAKDGEPTRSPWGSQDKPATASSMTAVAFLARHRSDSSQPTISRVQQSIIALR